MEFETEELVLGLLTEENESELKCLANEAGKQVRINRDPALLLTFMYPKTFPKVLRLLEFCNVDAVVLNGKGENIEESNILYRNIRDVVCNSHLYVLLFRKDQQLVMADDDSENEFVVRYNTQKKYYKRNDKVYKYEYHRSNRYHLEDLEGNQDVRLDYKRRVCSCHGFMAMFYRGKRVQPKPTEISKSFQLENTICEHLLFVDMIVFNQRLIDVKPLEQQNILLFNDPNAMMNFLLENC